MYLLHCSLNEDGSPRICLDEFDRDPPPYAILSHRWREDEVLFKDCYGVEDIIGVAARIKEKKGYKKLVGACRKALEHGFEYIWIDTCCIDQSSSAELSEAINSMYRWYETSERCYAYLDDYEPGHLGKCEWFTRGWTLQELVAPTELVFYDAKWEEIGTKSGLAGHVAGITRITEQVLIDGLHVHSLGVAEKMSWAADRKTLREEDRAYSVMGLFGVHMPPIYGEGGSRAFERLQGEIIRMSNDHTIFTWHGYGTFLPTGALASSPDQFRSDTHYPVDYETYIQAFDIPRHAAKPDFTVTNFGLYIQLPIAPITQHPGYYYGFLAAGRFKSTREPAEWPVIYLYCKPRSAMVRFVRTSFEGRWVGSEPVGNRIFMTTPVFLSLFADTLPLVWSQAPEPFSSTAKPPPSNKHAVTIILAKEHQSIHVADAHMGDCVMDSNEILMTSFEKQDAMRSDLGRANFHGLRNYIITREISANQAVFSSEDYSDGQHLVTLIVTSRIGQMLMVVAMENDAFLLVVAEPGNGLSASGWRSWLFASKESLQQERTGDTVPTGPNVTLKAAVIPFDCKTKEELRLGRYSIAMEREIHGGYAARAFRVTVGLRPQPSTWTEATGRRQAPQTSTRIGYLLADIPRAWLDDYEFRHGGQQR